MRTSKSSRSVSPLSVGNRDSRTFEPTTRTLRERLIPARAVFGAWPLRDVERAAAEIAGWRATLSDTSRYRLTLALRQALGAAVRWGYIGRNPAVDAGRNPEPRAVELRPFKPPNWKNCDHLPARKLALLGESKT